MKKFILFFFILQSLKLLGQDSIFYKNGNVEIGIILSIEVNTISFKKFTNPDGPTYNKPISDIIKVKYKNGELETFKPTKTIDDLTQKENKIFLEIDTQDIQGFYEIVFEEFKKWNYWEIVDKRDEAEFILQLKTIKKGAGGFSWAPRIKVQAFIRMPNNQLLWTSDDYQGNSNAFSGFSAKKDVINKLIYKGIEPRFKILRK